MMEKVVSQRVSYILPRLSDIYRSARDPLCDLLSLLLTGRPVTTALTELIENGAQTTERVRGASV
jgi:hypothetical protein